ATTLVLTSGTGNITLGAGVGTSTALTGFTITQANTVSTQAVTATFIAQNAGTGTTTFNGAVNTTGASGIALTGNNFTFSNTFTTAGGGAVTIVDAGVATFNGVGSVAGAVTVNGAAFASTITAGGAIAVNGAATVSGTGSLT